MCDELGDAHGIAEFMGLQAEIKQSEMELLFDAPHDLFMAQGVVRGFRPAIDALD